MAKSKAEQLVNTEIKYKKRIKIVLGLFFCLLSIFGAIGYGVVAEFITWIISFFVGGYFSYVVYALLFIIGLLIMFYKKKNKYKLKLIITGLIFMYIGSIILFSTAVTTYQGDTNTYLSFSSATFANQFQSAISVDTFPKADFATNCGIIGFLLVALINTALTHVGSYIIGSFLIILGFVLVTYKLIKKFFKRILSKEYEIQAKEIVEEEPVVEETELIVKPIKQNKKEEHLTSSSTLKHTTANDGAIFSQTKEKIKEEESHLEKIDLETTLSKRPTKYEKTKNLNSDLKKAIYESSLYNEEEEGKVFATRSNQNSNNLYDAVKSFAMGQDYLTVTMIINTFNIDANRASKIFIKLQEDGIIDSDEDDEVGNRVLIHSS